MVDRTNDNEEKNQCAKEKIPENTAKRRTTDQQKKPVHRGEKEVPNSNTEGKNVILEAPLHHNYTKQPLE
jgi:hypothetical protein